MTSDAAAGVYAPPYVGSLAEHADTGVATLRKWMEPQIPEEVDEAAPTDAHAGAPVKNTFIHYDVGEQPDWRPSKSAPTWRANSSADKSSRAFMQVRRNDPMQDANTDVPSEENIIYQSTASSVNEPPRALPVKNTFIHLDVGDQPEYRPTVSGPASMNRVPYADPAFVPLSSTLEESASSPRWSPEVGQTDCTANTEGTMGPVFLSIPSASLVPSAGQFDADPSLLPSVGSVGHAAEKCKPCAHIWKPNGCDKGHFCTFCHLCDEEDFKRKRKEKLSRLKHDVASRKRNMAQNVVGYDNI